MSVLTKLTEILKNFISINSLFLSFCLFFALHSCKSTESQTQGLEITSSEQIRGQQAGKKPRANSKSSARELNPTPPPVDPGSTGKSEYLTELLSPINSERANGRNCGNEIFDPASKLDWNNDLALAALEHAADLSYHSGMRGHVGSDSSRVIERIRRHTTEFNNFAENVVMGRIQTENTVTVFLNSPGHCRNIMNHVYTHFGAARHYNPETGRTATVYKFGRKRGADTGPRRERKFIKVKEEY
ncbi:uncharacterized protein YkwD [Mongoliibacter ruber]|uniref:Uncharacterized protein YkwD n=1 Tax=Mongoliibacter ruber TaxID=1750599 RepID=A0A2T0WW93_9BACT|nr:uncharacterized protein YkwD [Mongoliibacter ruber]